MSENISKSFCAIFTTINSYTSTHFGISVLYAYFSNDKCRVHQCEIQLDITGSDRQKEFFGFIERCCVPSVIFDMEC